MDVNGLRRKCIVGVAVCAWVASAAGCTLLESNDLADVPGVVVHYVPSPSVLDRLFDREVYTTSPSIVVMPDGDYVLTHTIFGAGSGADVSGTTHVFRSSDKGSTWTHTATLTDMKRGSLFVHDGALYLFGYRNSDGDILIRKSTDKGDSWTTPTDAAHGLLQSGGYGGTPHNPVVFDGRLWVAQGGRRVMSARVGSNLLLTTSWMLSNLAATGNGPFGTGLTITEAQIVASPQTGVVLLPKIGGLPNTVLIRATSTLFGGNVEDPSDEDWVSLPGGEKKFGAAYDPVSERFYVLTNPVLPAHDAAAPPQLVRNTAALLSSVDLRHWDVEQIFLYSPNVDYEAFQYLNFDFDGEDLVVASRTAFDVGGRRPPRGHDSNLITFHRIEDFRNARPEYELVIDRQNHAVLRYERTQHESAPLGPFTLGSTFAGSPLVEPVAVGQDAAGDVYVREESGRVLRFDVLGNFLETVDDAPIPLLQGKLAISPPPEGERVWTAPGSGDWHVLTNWLSWNRPDTDDEVANLGSAIESDSRLTVDHTLTVKGLRIRSDHSYTIAGDGALRIAAESGVGVLEAFRGQHQSHLPVTFATDVSAHSAPDAALHFWNDLDLDGHTLRISGDGVFKVHAAFAMGGGRLVLDLRSSVHFGDTVQASLDGELIVAMPGDAAPALHDRFKLIEGMEHVDGAFERVVLPDLPASLRWDTATFGRDGIVRVVDAGEAGW